MHTKPLARGLQSGSSEKPTSVDCTTTQHLRIRAGFFSLQPRLTWSLFPLKKPRNSIVKVVEKAVTTHYWKFRRKQKNAPAKCTLLTKRCGEAGLFFALTNFQLQFPPPRLQVSGRLLPMAWNFSIPTVLVKSAKSDLHSGHCVCHTTNTLLVRIRCFPSTDASFQ